MPTSQKSVKTKPREHKVTLPMPVDLVRAVRHLAVERTEPSRRVTFKGLVADAVREYVARN